jgi:hypothetical protein
MGKKIVNYCTERKLYDLDQSETRNICKIIKERKLWNKWKKEMNRKGMIRKKLMKILEN